jgi:hypothetical protein
VLCPHLAELNVLFDLVVEVIHRTPLVSHPVIPKPFWALGLVPQVGVPKATERMVSSLVRSVERVHVPKLLESRVKMTTDDVRRRDGFSCPSAEKKTRTAVARKLSKEIGNRRDTNAGTSMISKSQEETEVSWRLKDWGLEAGVEQSSWRTACDPA